MRLLPSHRAPASGPRSILGLLVVLSVLAIGGDGAANAAGIPARHGVRPPRAVTSSQLQILVPVSSGVSFNGAGLAVSGDLMLIGVPGTTNGAGGAVYAYRYAAGAWTALAAPTLTRHGDTMANFGQAIAMSGTTAIVGAPNDGGGGGGPGSVWRYEFDGGTSSWDAGTEIEAPMGTPEGFGTSVAISGDRIAIGAPHTGSNPAIDGAVVVYGPSEPTGTLIRASADRAAPAIMAASDDLFGSSVAIDADSLLVGAPSNDEVAPEAGAAFAFEASDGWTARVAFLPTAMFRQRYGTSVALGGGGTIAVVGAPEAGTGAADNRGTVFARVRASDAEPWPAAAEPLLAEDAAPSSYFGQSVAIDGTRLLVGAPLRDGPIDRAGGAYLFERRADAWVATAILQMAMPADVSTGARLGDRVAISGDRIAVAATEGPTPGANVGFVAAFAPPSPLGTGCATDGACESAFCTDGVCCEARCDGDCLACSPAGSCDADDEGMACTTACGAGTCGTGVCSSATACDAGVDAGPMDGGGIIDRPIRRVSGCKCAVGAGAPSDGALAASVWLALALVARRRR